MSVLAACGTSSNAQHSTAAASTTVPSAQLRGQTVRLLTHDAFAVSKSVLAAFTAQTGVKVQVLRQGDAGAMVNAAILTRDHPQADVLYGVDTTFVSRALDHRLFAPRAYRGLDRLSAAARSSVPGGSGYVVPVDFGDVCLNLDRPWFDRHPSVPMPTRIGDLVDPRYRSLTVVENPASSSPGLAFVLATIERFGDGWTRYWQQLRRNDVLVADSWTTAYESDFSAGGGKGTRPIVVSYASSPPADVVYAEDGRTAPHVTAVTDGCFRQYEYAGVLHGAAHPDAGQLLVEYLVGPQFQADMPLQMYVFPTRIGTPLPSVFERFAVVPPAPESMAPARITRNRDDWISQWTAIVAG